MHTNSQGIPVDGKMNKTLKTKWLAALRSGKYEQGKEWLCKNDKYCCLGVLCEIAGLPKDKQNYDGTIIVDYDGMSETLPVKFAQENGIRHMGTLAEMNDLDGKSFAEIADWIEEHL